MYEFWFGVCVWINVWRHLSVCRLELVYLSFYFDLLLNKVTAHIPVPASYISCIYMCVCVGVIENEYVCVYVWLGRELTLINSCFLPFFASPRRVSSSCSSGTFKSDIRFMFVFPGFLASLLVVAVCCAWLVRAKSKKRLETLKREFCFFFSFHSVAYYIQREERCERKERACGGDEMERKGERESERDSVGGQMTFFLLFFISIFLAFSTSFALSLSLSPFTGFLIKIKLSIGGKN